jgi:AAA domain
MPELSGRPLLDTKPDQAFYVPRIEPQEAVWSAIRRDLNTLVIGERGAGKTTFLRYLAYSLRAEGVPAAFVEGGVAGDAAGFFGLVLYRLGAAPSRLQGAVSTFHAMAQPAGPPLVELTQELRSALSDRPRTVVLVDEMPSVKVAHTIFGRLRDEVWQLPLTWVVAVADNDSTAYLTPPADAFFDVVTELRPLTYGEQVDFLHWRLGAEA